MGTLFVVDHYFNVKDASLRAMSTTTTKSTKSAEVEKGGPAKINVEESRQQRINKLKSKYRDRGG